MSRRIREWCGVCLGAVAVLAFVGCTTNPGGGGGGGGIGPVPVALDLSQSGGLGTFEAEAGVPTDNRGTGSFSLSGLTAGSGEFLIDPEAITVTPTGPQKGLVAAQATSTLIITAWIDTVENSETVCGGGEEYGPFDVTLDEDFVPVEVDPNSITLTQNTIDLLNLGQFSLCIRVESPIDATVEIARLNFNLSQ